MLKEKIQNLFFYTKIKALYKKHERQAIPAMLVLGFVADVVTFRSIDLGLAFVLLAVHIFLVGVAIAFINIYDTHWANAPGKIISYLRILAPLAMQFSFGALFSAAFIFYTFGGVFSVSWPLIILVFFLMASNEIFKQSYLKPSVQISAFFFVLFTLSALVLPYIFNSISPWIFILAGIVSLLFITAGVYFLSQKIPIIKAQQKKLAWQIAAIFLFMNGLYFLNIIPPVPLSLRDGGVYHKVALAGREYNLSSEKQSFWQKIIPGRTVSVVNGSPIYVFTAVFSPADLNTQIVHHWQKYDEELGEWASMKKLSFMILGGRKEGYRGYSVSSNVAPGKWRVYVETKRGQVLGKVSFEVKRAETAPETEVVIR